MPPSNDKNPKSRAGPSRGSSRHQSEDISSLLTRWTYDEDKNIRRIRMKSGREVIQVRLPLGIEQYEINGRPDGLKPKGFESWLDHYKYQAGIYGREFVLDDPSCDKLVNEGMLYYYRYLLFFQIQEYDLCIRDTSRNLRLLEFVKKYAGKEDQAETLEQYRPYILRMQTMARTLNRVKKQQDLRGAIRILRLGIKAIRDLPDMDGNEVFAFERKRSIKWLEDLEGQLEEQLPVSRRAVLHKELQEAVEAENYERAAKIRDKLRGLS